MFKETVRTAQIIRGAMLAGTIFIAVVFTTLAGTGNVDGPATLDMAAGEASGGTSEASGGTGEADGANNLDAGANATNDMATWTWMIGGVIAATALVAALSAPPMLLRSITRTPDEQTHRQIVGGDELDQLPPGLAGVANHWRTSTIIQSALLEGAAVINLVLHLVFPNAVHLALVGVLVLALLATFPKPSSLRSWLAASCESGF